MRSYKLYTGPHYAHRGAQQFVMLLNAGMTEDSTVLDFGCGSLALGRLCIPFLKKGKYYGIEPNTDLLWSGLENELGEPILDVKNPHFAYNDDFDIGIFDDVVFDFIMIHSIFSHATREQISKTLKTGSERMHDYSVLIATYCKGKTDSCLDAWQYPEPVFYKPETMRELCEDANLHFVPSGAKNICGQNWFVASKRNIGDVLCHYPLHW